MHRFMAPVNLAPQQIQAGNTNETVQLPKEYVKRKGFVGIPIYVIGLMFYQGSYIYIGLLKDYYTRSPLILAVNLFK